MKNRILAFLLIPLFAGCTSSQLQDFIQNAPAVISSGIATASDLDAAYAAANQQLNGKSLSVSTGITAAQAAIGSGSSTNLSGAVTSVFTNLNTLVAGLKSAPAPAVISAESAQLVAGQTAVQAVVASNPTVTHFRYIWKRDGSLKLFAIAN